jgi:hypothetical protein
MVVRWEYYYGDREHFDCYLVDGQRQRQLGYVQKAGHRWVATSYLHIDAEDVDHPATHSETFDNLELAKARVAGSEIRWIQENCAMGRAHR